MVSSGSWSGKEGRGRVLPSWLSMRASIPRSSRSLRSRSFSPLVRRSVKRMGRGESRRPPRPRPRRRRRSPTRNPSRRRPCHPKRPICPRPTTIRTPAPVKRSASARPRRSPRSPSSCTRSYRTRGICACRHCRLPWPCRCSTSGRAGTPARRCTPPCTWTTTFRPRRWPRCSPTPVVATSPTRSSGSRSSPTCSTSPTHCGSPTASRCDRATSRRCVACSGPTWAASTSPTRRLPRPRRSTRGRPKRRMTGSRKLVSPRGISGPRPGW